MYYHNFKGISQLRDYFRIFVSYFYRYNGILI